MPHSRQRAANYEVMKNGGRLNKLKYMMKTNTILTAFRLNWLYIVSRLLIKKRVTLLNVVITMIRLIVRFCLTNFHQFSLICFSKRARGSFFDLGITLETKNFSYLKH